MKLTFLVVVSVLTFMLITQTGNSVEIDKVDFDIMYPQPQEHWYSFQMMGKKIGFVHTFMEKTEFQNEEMLRVRNDVTMQLSGLGKEFTVEISRIEYLDDTLTPRYFISTSNESGEKHIEGKIIDNKAFITTTINGKSSESEVAIPPDTISENAAVEYLLSKSQMEIGTKLNYNTLSYDLYKPVKSELTIIGKELLTYQSEDKHVYVIEINLDIFGGYKSRIWMTEDGTTYKTTTDMMGLSFIATKTDRATALGGIEEVDIMLQSRIVPTGIKPKRGTTRLVANLRLSNGNLTDTIIENHRQSLKIIDDRNGTLSIEVAEINEEDCVKLPINNPEYDPFLSSSVYIESKNEKIKLKAQEIIDGEENSWKAARKLGRWVFNAISDKRLTGGYNTSLATLDSLTGDCTEHTVLLIALARAVGIPARICSGLIHTGGGFYYHFWVEVYVGRWVQLDPALGQDIADAGHIQLGGSVIESDTMVEFTEGSVRTINQLEVDILE